MRRVPEISDTGASHAHPQKIEANSIGSFAYQRLKQAQFGKVTSIFNRSLYLDINGDWICLADGELGCSPITINIDHKYAKGWLHRFKIGRLVEISPFSISLDNCPIISVEELYPWRPEKPPKWSKTALKQGLDALEIYSQAKIPAEGLGCFLNSAQKRKHGSPESLAAEKPIKSLESWVQENFEESMPVPPENEFVAALVGLGPGLTPSGDDFLGGMLIALHVFEQAKIRNQLFFQIGPLLQNTGPVSRAYLMAATEGEGHEVIHRMLNVLFEGDAAKIRLAAEEIGHLGHTSGWDVMAGAVTVLRKITSGVI